MLSENSASDFDASPPQRNTPSPELFQNLNNYDSRSKQNSLKIHYMGTILAFWASGFKKKKTQGKSLWIFGIWSIIKNYLQGKPPSLIKKKNDFRGGGLYQLIITIVILFFNCVNIIYFYPQWAKGESLKTTRRMRLIVFWWVVSVAYCYFSLDSFAFYLWLFLLRFSVCLKSTFLPLESNGSTAQQAAKQLF